MDTSQGQSPMNQPSPMTGTPMSASPLNSSPMQGMNMPAAMGSSNDGKSSPAGHKKVGPIIVTLVVVLVIIIAALYFFASHVNEQPVPTDAAGNDTAGLDATSGTSGTAAVPPVTNSSTDVGSLQSDLNTSTQGLDSQNF